MNRIQFFFLILLAYIGSAPAQSSPYAPVMDDCKQITACTVNNNTTFRNGTVTGARADARFIKCSSNNNNGDWVEFCINNDPIKPPDQRVTDCAFSCEPSAIGWNFDDANDVIRIGIIKCEGCGPSPSPTPTPPPPGPSCPNAEFVHFGSCPVGYTPDPFAPGWCCPGDPEACTCSPVLVDVAGDGFLLTNKAGGVRFDMNADGVIGRTAWVSTDADDAFLVLDRNGNGSIDNGSELFGDFSPQPEPGPGIERNGFLALAEYDRPETGGNGDGVITASDVIFHTLRLWRDANHNGVSEPYELHSLSELGLKSIDLDYKQSRKTDQHGNQFKFRAKIKDDKGSRISRWAWDVFFNNTP